MVAIWSQERHLEIDSIFVLTNGILGRVELLAVYGRLKMSEKLCKDCKWVRRRFGLFYHLAKCAAPNAHRVNKSLITGKEQLMYCFAQRNYDDEKDMCGYEGKFWEAKDGK